MQLPEVAVILSKKLSLSFLFLAAAIGGAAVNLAPCFQSAANAEEGASLLKQPGHLQREFIYDDASFPQCHASTLAETPNGIVAAWFGGTREKNPDVGVWVARRGKDGGWSAPVEAANGVQNEKLRYPCWNPVLHQQPGGPLLLFYKVGPSPSEWWGMVIASSDSGQTWGKPRRLPDGILGPIKNKAVLLSNGVLLSPSSSEHDGWRVHMEMSADGGKTWTHTKPLNDGRTTQAIQPTVFVGKSGALQILCRSRGLGKILAADSIDFGKTWSPLKPLDLPNPNSGIDGVTLSDGRRLLIYNHAKRGRSPLNVAISRDGALWRAALVLENEPGEYSYPAVIQTSDGLVHITYTWKRHRVRHVTLDPAKLVVRDFVDGAWPR